MTLQLPATLGLGEQQQQALHSAWDNYDQVHQTLMQLGMFPTCRPPFDRPIPTPEQYANLEGDDFHTLMNQVDRWFDYASGLKAELDGRLIAIENEMDILGVDIRTRMRQEVEAGRHKKLSEAELKDLVKTVPRVRELMKTKQDLDIALLRVKSILDSLERYAKGLSRQVTLREQNIQISGANTGRGLRRLTP